MNNREQFEVFLIGEYEWAEGALNAAIFCGDDATGHYVCGEHIYDRQDCSECLFWAWRGWQAASKASEQQLLELSVKLANVESKCAELASENARMKTAAEFATAPDMWIEQADGMLDYRYVDWYVDVLKAAMETPATDADIANIQAQGVEMLYASRAAQWTDELLAELDEFVTQLREGGAA